MKQKRKFLFFCMIIVGKAAFSQLSPQFKTVIHSNNQSFNSAGRNFKPSSIIQLPANFSCSQLGFFCRTEIKFEKATRIPFKFRLGSVQYNDWLEGKANSGVLPY
ncbi:MAG: hypothetical protein ABIO04_12410 [Ferruginibacter sp.]